MLFPWLSRRQHDAEVKALRNQVVALAKLLYPNGVPEEFQLLVGIEIPHSDSATSASVTTAGPEPLTAAQQAEDEEEGRIRGLQTELRSRMRTRPSTVGPYLERIMKQTSLLQSRAAHPTVAKIFAQADAEVSHSA